MDSVYIPATPFAKLLAKERGVDIRNAVPTGFYGEVRSSDILSAAGREERRATPLASRMAEKLGLDMKDIAGTGYDGKVCKTDILSAVESQRENARAAAESRVRMSGMRKAISRRMLKSHTEIPSVTHIVKNDVTSLLEARTKINASGKKKYSINDFILKAVIKALAANPQILACIDGDDIIYKEKINLGMAVAVDAGLVVPVIRDARAMSLDELSETARGLAAKARENKLSPDEYKGHTFTVSNLGMCDVESFTPIINQPDAAILGVCCVSEEPALLDGAVALRKVMRTCLTYDHRLLDGAGAAKFQKELKRLLENPIEIIM